MVRQKRQAIIKQTRRRSKLKKQALRAFVLLSILFSLSANNVYAHGAVLINRVDIPFDFSVGAKKFPAGVYNITRVNQEKIILRLSSADGREAINIVTNSIQARETPKTSKLIFHRYGETYFLYQIWESEEVQGRQLAKSQTERTIEHDLSKSGERVSVVDLVATP